MHSVFNKVGYRSYHMLEAARPSNSKDHHINCWQEALYYKVYGLGKPYLPAGFDKILQNYSVSLLFIIGTNLLHWTTSN
jgi:hypothetical protein